MKLKKGVKLAGIQPEIVAIFLPIEHIAHEFGIELIITSVNDSNHSENSLHYTGYAIDIRIRELYSYNIRIDFRNAIAEEIGNEFDVVLESDHIHIEFDPKNT